MSYISCHSMNTDIVIFIMASLTVAMTKVFVDLISRDPPDYDIQVR